MKQRLLRAGKITAGILLLIFGVVGLFLPFLQGILFIILGLSLLSTESPRAKAWLEYVQERTGWKRRQVGNEQTGRTDHAG
jgi:uncharacterized membrane protein YbaN (DUF454 family)